MRYPGFFGGSSTGASYMADGAELINLMLQKTPNAASPYCYIGTPGFESLFTVATGPSRGSTVANGLTYVVAGYGVYEWNGVTATLRATLTAADSNPATLCWNGPAGGQLFITSGDVGYCLDLTTFVLTVVLTSGAAMGAYLDGFFLALDAATGTLQISDLLDGLVWDPTQIAQRSQGADPWVAMTVTNAEIDLMGTRTRETWANAGTSPFPFQPIPGAFREQGIAAPYSLPRDVSPVVWVSSNAQGARQVLMRQGYDGISIGSDDLVYALQRYASVSLATSFSFQEAGHTFVALIFPDEDAWLYDLSEGTWAKWRYWNHMTSTWEPVRVRTHVLTPDGMHIVGDRSNGAFYRMGIDLYDDVDGEIIRRERTPPVMRAPGNVRFIVDEIQLVMDVGVGVLGSDETDPDVYPQAMLQTSRDGGKTWALERTAPIGMRGRYNTRVFWTNCGQARTRQDRFRFACRVPIRIVDAEVKVRVGTS